MDQDYGLMYRMNIAANVYGILVKVRGMTGHSIHSLTDPERRLIATLRKMEVM